MEIDPDDEDEDGKEVHKELNARIPSFLPPKPKAGSSTKILAPAKSLVFWHKKDINLCTLFVTHANKAFSSLFLLKTIVTSSVLHQQMQAADPARPPQLCLAPFPHQTTSTFCNFTSLHVKATLLSTFIPTTF